MEIFRGLEHLLLWEGLRAGTVQLGEEEAQGALTDVYKYLKGRCKEDAVRPFSVVCSDGRRNNGLKLKYRKFCFNMRERGIFYCDGAQTLARVA